MGDMRRKEVFNAVRLHFFSSCSCLLMRPSKFEWQRPTYDDNHSQPRPEARQITHAMPAPIRSPSPSPITSDEDIPLRQSERLSERLPPAILRSPVHSPQKLDESCESEESMMLGLDFV